MRTLLIFASGLLVGLAVHSVSAQDSRIAGMNLNHVMIRVENLTKDYGTFRAVDQVTFNVRRGEVLGFLGPNGAGKSTTMRMIIGLDRPTSGRITLNGWRYADLHEVGALSGAAG